MQDFPLELIIEVLVAILLVATVFYCHILNKRLKTLRQGQDGLRELIESLGVATERARLAIAEMKNTSEAASISLQDQIGKARSLSDELSVIVESGNNLAGRIETNLTGTRRPASRPTEQAQPVQQQQASSQSPSQAAGAVASSIAAQEFPGAGDRAPLDQGGGVAAPSDDPEQARKALMDALRQTR